MYAPAEVVDIYIVTKIHCWNVVSGALTQTILIAVEKVVYLPLGFFV